MRIEDFIDFCQSHEHLLCYGGGLMTKFVVEYLKRRKIQPEACIVTGQPPSRTFMDVMAYKSVFDYEVKPGERYGIILSLQSMYHQEVAKYVAEQFGNQVDIFPLTEYSVEQLEVVVRAELRDCTLNQLVNPAQPDKDSYEERIKSIKKSYQRVLLRFLFMPAMGSMSSWLNYCYERDRLFDDGFFYLFFAAPRIDQPELLLTGANSFLLSKLKRTGMEVVSEENIDFWRYFYQHDKGIFIMDEGYSMSEWMNGRANVFFTQHEFAGKQSVIELTPQEDYQGFKQAADMGIRGEYACFSARDLLWEYAKADIQSNTIKTTSKFRNSDITTCRRAMESLSLHGMQAVRMGAIVSRKLDWDNTIDYAHEHRSEFMDVWLAKHCSFFASNPSGINALAQLCMKPMVSYNAIGPTLRGDAGIALSRRRDLGIMKKMWWPKENRFLTLSEILEIETDFSHHERSTAGSAMVYEQMGIDVIDNTEEEIAAVVNEMALRIKGEMFYSEEDEQMVQHYFYIIDKFPLKHNFPYMWRIGLQFIKNNHWLLK